MPHAPHRRGSEAELRDLLHLDDREGPRWCISIQVFVGVKVFDAGSTIDDLLCLVRVLTLAGYSSEEIEAMRAAGALR